MLPWISMYVPIKKYIALTSQTLSVHNKSTIFYETKTLGKLSCSIHRISCISKRGDIF